MFDLTNAKIAIIGLGYVGLPLAVELGKKFTTMGFDIRQDRVEQLQRGKDSTFEVSAEFLAQATQLFFTTDSADHFECNVFIVTVPTPVNNYNQPELTPLKKASHVIAQLLKKGDIVIYESTVFPTATEEICVPILEQESALSFNKDFFVSYSPERINPGDKKHNITTILKVTSGSSFEVAEFVDNQYIKYNPCWYLYSNEH